MPRNDEFLLRLREANPIETVMGNYVNLVRRGRNYVCNCPFHSEKTPSCYIYLGADPHFYCFGCGAGGDVITFIMKMENLTFTEAVNFLAQRAGLEVPHKDPKEAARARLKTRIYEMNRLAANFYYKNLVSGPDKSGLKYFADRKLTPATIKKYGLGFAPNSWNSLTDYLRSKGYTDDEIVAGWLGGSKNGRVFDMFRNRVMFPIVDTRGNIIGFGGRVLDDSKPKYLNTGDTPVFYKGSNLFSLNFAKNSNTKRMILCEGYMDVIAVNQAGFENVVATLGTAITPEQARLMSHYAEEIIIAYDSDGAGQKATRKAINHFEDVGLRTKIIHMEGAKDPDEFIKKFGANRFRILLDGSDDANAYLLAKCEEGLDLATDAGKVEVLKRAANVLAAIESPLEREVYISRTSKRTGIDVQVLKNHIDQMLRARKKNLKKSEWRNITSAAYQKDPINPESALHRKESRAEETIICYLLRHPDDAQRMAKEAPPEIFLTPFNKKVYTALLDRMSGGDRFSLSLLADEFSPDEMGRISGIDAKNREFTIDSTAAADCVKVLKEYKSPAGDQLSDEDLSDLFRSKISK